MTRLRHLAGADAFILVLDGLVFAAFSILAPGFASIANIENVLVSALPLLLLATGQTLVLVTGGIDLSAPSIVGLASVVGAIIMSSHAGWLGGHPLAAPIGLASMLVVGAAAGLVNGVSVAWFRMPPFMVTLASMTFCGGLAVWLARTFAQSDSIDGLPAIVLAFGRGVSAAVLLALAAVAAAGVLLERTLLGRWMRAVGYNARTARVCGVPVKTVIISAFMLGGVFAALAGVLLTARLETGSPLHGRPLLLDVIGAAVIGGASLFGGRGTVVWTMCGVMFLALVSNGLMLLNLSDFAVTIVKGAVILAAALLDVWRTRWISPDR